MSDHPKTVKMCGGVEIIYYALEGHIMEVLHIAVMMFLMLYTSKSNMPISYNTSRN